VATERVDDQQVVVDVRLDRASWSRHLAEQTLAGLRDDPPWIPPVWFYDDVGSELFDRITRLPEYYPTETERGILAEHAQRIAALTGATTLAELGSGTSDKTALLLEAFRSTGLLHTFAPFDCSEEVLRSAAGTVASEHPGLAVHAVVGDFHEHLAALPTAGTCVLAFLGSTIGNLDPHQRAAFLGDVHDNLDADDFLLLGVDLVKPVDRLLAAYDDSEGVTAAFNLNCLSVLNRELGTDFDTTAFRHRAVWDATTSRIEMHLVATRTVSVHLGELGTSVRLDEGDHIRTEISTKFTVEGITGELVRADFGLVELWSDPAEDFAVLLARPG